MRAVLTAEDLKPLNLHYMPTLAGDVQAVLADGKVLFQNQEIVFVVADDRYVAADAVELIEVEYEELPALNDPEAALADGAAVLREDLAGKTAGAHGARGITITSSPGRSATRRRPSGRSRRPRSASRRRSSISGCTPARSRPAPASPRWTR